METFECLALGPRFRGDERRVRKRFWQNETKAPSWQKPKTPSWQNETKNARNINGSSACRTPCGRVTDCTKPCHNVQ